MRVTFGPIQRQPPRLGSTATFMLSLSSAGCRGRCSTTTTDAWWCRILADGTRKRARLFSGFLSHYVIQDRYGRPGKGNDKGSVEGLVGWARRNFMVPLPRFASWDDFNDWLEAQCRKRHADILRGHTETIGQRLQRDLQAMAELPPAPFDACEQATGQVSSQSLVRYQTNDYSVPVAYGHRDVWVRGYVDQVVIGCGGEVIARHPRCYDREDMVRSITCPCWSRRSARWIRRRRWPNGTCPRSSR